MLNVFDIATEEPLRQTDVGVRFAVDPDALYPLTIAHIQQVLKNGAKPDGVLGNYYDEALKVPPEDWQLALDSAERGTPLTPVGLERRAVALEIARVWFTEMLHRAAGGGPMTVHILPSDGKWRLNAQGVLPRAQAKQMEQRVLARLFGWKIVKG